MPQSDKIQPLIAHNREFSNFFARDQRIKEKVDTVPQHITEQVISMQKAVNDIQLSIIKLCFDKLNVEWNEDNMKRINMRTIQDSSRQFFDLMQQGKPTHLVTTEVKYQQNDDGVQPVIEVLSPWCTDEELSLIVRFHIAKSSNNEQDRASDSDDADDGVSD